MPLVAQPDDLVERLGEIVLPSAEDVATRLGDLWADQTVLLVHLRHFGCILCRHFAVQLADAQARVDAAGARIVAIGTGGRAYAREFKEDRGIEFTVLVDKNLVSHGIVGARSGRPLGIFRPSVLAAAGRALAAGQMQGKTGPHPWLFGASHIIGAGGELRFAWVNANYHDNPTLERLLEVVGASPSAA